jgi:DNA-binding IclR family transcriptional regulator
MEASVTPIISRRRKTAQPTIVKSAGRALEILELFDQLRKEISVVDVCRALGYPQSSASLLLRTLSASGYLRYDRERRTYEPTNKVPLLGSWVNPPVFRDGGLHRLLEEISLEAGCPATIVARNSCWSDCIYSTHPLTEDQRRVGATTVNPFLPLTASAAGHVILSALPEAEAGRIIRRLQAEQPTPELTSPLQLADLRVVAQRGHAIRRDPERPRRFEVATRAPLHWQELHAIEIRGEADRAGRAPELLAEMLAALVARHFRAGEPERRPQREAHPFAEADAEPACEKKYA